MRQIQPIIRTRYKTLVCVPNYYPELIVENNLSKKPKEAAKKLKEIVEAKNSICKINPHSNGLEYEGYDVKIKQDYSNGTVTLGLSSWPQFTHDNNMVTKEQSFISTVLPATAAVKRYTKALKDMVENPNKETVKTSRKIEKLTPDKKKQMLKPDKKWYEFWK